MRIIESSNSHGVFKDELIVSTVKEYRQAILEILEENKRESEGKIFDDTIAKQFQNEELIMWNKRQIGGKTTKISQPYKYNPVLDPPGTERN